MQPNFYILPIAALIPLLLGFIWYQPKVFGTALATATGKPINQIGNQGSIARAAFTYLFGLFMAYVLLMCSVHQFATALLFVLDPAFGQEGSEFSSFLTDFNNKYGDRHRTFGHGVIHGMEVSALMSFAFLGISTFIEGLPMKRMWIHFGYFVLCGGLMGGLICAYF